MSALLTMNNCVCAQRLRSSTGALVVPKSRGPVSKRAVIRAQKQAKVASRSVKLVCRAEVTGTTATADKAGKCTPAVRIDNTSDPFATVVTVEFGDELGELLETITALKNLALNIRSAKLGAKKNFNTFYVTDADTSEKILRSARLEEIRMTIINSLLALYPETAGQLSTGEAQTATATRDLTSPLGRRRRIVVPTTIDVVEASNGSCSVLKVVTRDRPGLLVDIVRVLKDINVNVVSAEVDTIGTEARDEFFVTYHGEPLNSSMVQLVTNALQYYLSLAEVAKEESY